MSPVVSVMYKNVFATWRWVWCMSALLVAAVMAMVNVTFLFTGVVHRTGAWNVHRSRSLGVSPVFLLTSPFTV